MLTLGIETTCDETAAAIVEDGAHILSNVIFSQIEVHKKYGGVFPEMACREHVTKIIPAIDLALKEAEKKAQNIDLISVARGPGLVGALLVGLNTAKALAFAWNRPYIGVSHIEAHLYAAMMHNLSNLKFPALGVILSGGHTILAKILDLGSYELLGSTLDDAIGEAFDKVASLLNLPYPGGPQIESLAEGGDPFRYNFMPARVSDPFCFSFSGLKTKVLYTVKGQGAKKKDPLLIKDKKNVAASFQRAAFQDVIQKIQKATEKYEIKAIYCGGGVVSNKELKNMLKKKINNIAIHFPPPKLTLDNAAMIAGLGFQKFKIQKKGDPFDLPAMARIPLS